VNLASGEDVSIDILLADWARLPAPEKSDVQMARFAGSVFSFSHFFLW
jgi:hypothetical protein